MLASEVERLAGEQVRLEAHLARTDTWAEHLGSWRATVHSAEVIDESKPPQFVIVVHMAEQDSTADEKPEQITTGWELHRKLRPMCSELKNIELPSNSFKFIFGKNDRNSLEKAKILIQKYLEFVLEDDRLNQSEPLYTFLNPSSEYLKQGDLPKKNNNETTSRSSQEKEGFTHKSADDDEMSMYLDGNGGDGSCKHVTNSIRGKRNDGESRANKGDNILAVLGANAALLYKYSAEVLVARRAYPYIGASATYREYSGGAIVASGGSRGSRRGPQVVLHD
ncbi:unnamed protein product [Leptidea sinapis]|uniref:PX domain-containing protein n=1 Tax=Leptidea sinapis TaxID=189913 RepID=A0A5E4QZE9_9NEOP|nr:unnamed protein product [Leptidea sinapis]